MLLWSSTIKRWFLVVESPGEYESNGVPAPPLFLDQTKARKKSFRDRPTTPPPHPLLLYLNVWIQHGKLSMLYSFIREQSARPPPLFLDQPKVQKKVFWRPPPLPPPPPLPYLNVWIRHGKLSMLSSFIREQSANAITFNPSANSFTVIFILLSLSRVLNKSSSLIWLSSIQFFNIFIGEGRGFGLNAAPPVPPCLIFILGRNCCTSLHSSTKSLFTVIS